MSRWKMTRPNSVDVIDSSLQMVRDAAAYIGVISQKYGQTPKGPKCNPGQAFHHGVEFNEALRLGPADSALRHGREAPRWLKGDVETNAARMKKLERVS